MNKNQIRTVLGTLNARVRSDPDYPGIDIRLEQDGKEILLAWVEVDQYQKEPVLKLRLYADCHNDEPTDDRAISQSELDKYFVALVDGAIELI